MWPPPISRFQNMNILTMKVSEISLKPMFNFNSRSKILPQFRVYFPITRHHCLSLSPSPSPLCALENSPIEEEHSFEVSYLIKTFGWSPELAILKAKLLKFNTPEKPERFIAFLRKHGFTETQISDVLKSYPIVCLFDPEKTILPKFEFLSTLGLSRTEIAVVIAKTPIILTRSLENMIIPIFKLVSNLVNSDEEAAEMIKKYPFILARNPELDQILLKEGVPGVNIVASMIMTYQEKRCKSNPDSFRELVEEVKGMGFDPCSMKFLLVLQAIRPLSKSNREAKIQVLKKYGWTDSDIFLAFEKSPKFIWSSKDKIEGVLDFLVNEMGIKATDVANRPYIFGMSLQKRIVPRCLIYRSMVEKGLCGCKFSINTLCSLTEDEFISKIMEPCENEAPELWDLYMEMLDTKNDL